MSWFWRHDETIGNVWSGDCLSPGHFILGGMLLEKHCDCCTYSYRTHDRESVLPLFRLRQHCGNPQYNARPSTRLLLMEERESGYCPFWEPRAERKVS